MAQNVNEYQPITTNPEDEASHRPAHQNTEPTLEDPLADSELDQVAGGLGVGRTPAAPSPVPLPYPNTGLSPMIKG